MCFAVSDRPGRVRVQYGGEDVLEFVNEHLWFRSFRISNLRTRPRGPVECIGLATSCFYDRHYLRARIVAESAGEREVRITLTPERVDHDLDRIVHETRTITLRHLPERDRFHYDIRVHLRFLRDVRPQTPLLAITGMPQWGADDDAVVEFDDPLLAGGVGPQVPMTQDWQGIQEPWFDEHGFTTQWRKRYTHAILHTAARGWRQILLSKTRTSVQQFYNRHLLRCTPRSTFYYRKTDGNYLALGHDHPQPPAHHICEWGMDMHAYALFPKNGPERLFAAGQEITLDYHLEELCPAEVPAEVADAAPAELEPDERLLADAPLYEEPCCHFRESTLDHPDAQAWRLEGSGCWRREGGRGQAEGALVLEHGREAAESRWVFRFYGPSRACNPIPPFARHRIGAWVRAAQPQDAEVELRLSHINGPGMYASREVQVLRMTSAHRVRRDGDWERWECVTEPCGAYVLCGEIVFRYRGRGQACLSELSVARV
jgi:hypothetical protein